jgi:signal transduction histidine kinase
MTTVDLGGVAQDVVELYRPLAEERGADLDLTVKGSATAQGNRQLLFQAVANLIDNAVKYGAQGQHISVEVAGGPPSPVISVADYGLGIPAGEREHVLERFVRLDASRTTPGSGLGLSLVAAIARQHGATLELADTRPGEQPPGLTARLRFPREPDERLALPSAA